DFEYDAEAAKKHLKGDDVGDRLREPHAVLAALAPLDVATSEAAVRQVAEERGVSAAKLIHPLRLALTGRGASPPIFDVAVILGKERAAPRLSRLVLWGAG